MKKLNFRMLAGFMVLILIAFAVFVGCGPKENEENGNGNGEGKTSEPIIMRIGTVTNNDIHIDIQERFKALVEERSNGEIKCELYPGGQLGSNEQMLQNLQSGSLQGLNEPTAFLAGFDPVMQVFDLPTVLPNVKEATALLNSPVGDKLRQRLETKEISIIRFYQYGNNITLTTFDPSSFDNFKGKKIRVQPSEVFVNRMNATGAVGVPTPVPEIYTSLQQGTLEGVEGAENFNNTSKFHEVTNYVWLCPNAPCIDAFLVSKVWLDGLSEEHRNIILQAAIDIEDDINRIAEEYSVSALQNMEDAGSIIVEPTAEQWDILNARWEELVEPFLASYPDARPIYDAVMAGQ